MQNRIPTLFLILALTITAAGCSLLDAESEEAPNAMNLSVENPQAALRGGEDALHRADLNPMLADLRRATARYHRLEVAEEDGYELDDHCIPGMGFHALNEDLIDLELDHSQPEVLVYEQQNERLRLVAVEYIVPAAPWDTQHAEPPTLFGHDFHYTPPIEAYTLHVWLWKHNPAGLFAGTHPDAECPSGTAPPEHH